MTYDELLSLKATFTGLDAALAEEEGRRLYRELYLDEGKAWGIRETHDGQKVLFYRDGQSGFEHIFFTSSDLVGHPERKDILSVERLERIRWIGPVVRGEVKGVEFRKEHFWRAGKRMERRLYLLREERYVVWLEPRREGGWKVATAYISNEDILKSYCRKTFLSRTF